MPPQPAGVLSFFVIDSDIAEANCPILVDDKKIRSRINHWFEKCENTVPGPKGPITSLLPIYTIKISGDKCEHSSAIVTPICELEADTAALITSHFVDP